MRCIFLFIIVCRNYSMDIISNKIGKIHRWDYSSLIYVMTDYTSNITVKQILSGAHIKFLIAINEIITIHKTKKKTKKISEKRRGDGAPSPHG